MKAHSPLLKGHHLFQPWWEKVQKAVDAGAGHIYTFGIGVIEKDYEEFIDKRMNEAAPYSDKYKPNPYVFQYDLMVHIFLEFHDIKRREIERLNQPNFNLPDVKAKLAELENTTTLGGLERWDYLFGAAEIRWPTTIVQSTGALSGRMVRDPWAERRIKAICEEEPYIINFGGGGQGKTHNFLAFMLMMYEHYIFTNKGARCIFSTVNEGKLKSASWPYLQGLHVTSREGISLYCKKSKIKGDYTVGRPDSKDTAGVMQGVLINRTQSDASVIDKLTGSHGHPLLIALIDELQSSSNAPIEASSNYTMNAGKWWIFGAGNYDGDDDPLSNNTMPIGGWDSVTEETGEWVTSNKQGHRIRVLHFNNNYSPGMTDEGAKLWPYLPNKAKLEKQYPTESARSVINNTYRRFWIGFRIDNLDASTILSSIVISENQADLPLELDQTGLVHNFFSFDSAQAEIDRNPLGLFQHGRCVVTGKWVWGPKKIMRMPKSTSSMNYYTESAAEIINRANIYGVQSGNMILDFTGRPAQAELMQAKNFYVKKMTYNQAVPDGRRKDSITGYVDPPILLDRASMLWAHQKCYNKISLGAYALQQYIIAGRVRGLREDTIMHEFRNDGRTFQEEMFMRKMIKRMSREYGELESIDPKLEFKKKYGFSPDILDLLFQAAYYMLVYVGMPLTLEDDQAILNRMKLDDDEHEEHNSLWGDDLI